VRARQGLATVSTPWSRPLLKRHNRGSAVAIADSTTTSPLRKPSCKPVGRVPILPPIPEAAPNRNANFRLHLAIFWRTNTDEEPRFRAEEARSSQGDGEERVP
jgi:hypothetical protein